jgi:general secretion pathway protein D
MRTLTGRLLACLLVGTAVLPSSAFGQEPAQALNVQNADIRAFIQDVSKATGRTFVIDPAVQGNVSVAGGAPLNSDQLIEVFLATLRAHGYIAIPTSSGAWRIAPDSQGAQAPSGTGAERFVTQVIRLRTREAASVAPLIEPLVGRSGKVSAAQRSNTLVITDFADNVRRLAALVADLDRETDRIELVALRNSRPSVLAGALREITAAGGDGEKSFQAVTFTAVDTANSIVLRGPAETVARLKDIALLLDDQARPTGDTRVIFLQHADAAQMVDMLSAVVDQQRPPAGQAAAAASASPSATQRAIIARYEGANAIIVRGDPTVQQEVESIIRQLDRRSEQVLVQAIVVEIGEGAANKLGVQLLLGGTGDSDLPFFATNYSNMSPSLLTLSAALASGGLSLGTDLHEALQEAAAQSLLGSTGGVGGFASDIGGDGLFGLIFNAIKQDAGSNLISTPSLLTLNNREAEFLVGQNVPVTTGEVLSNNNNNPFRTVERQDIGVKLRVRPQINADGAITLFLSQEVSSVDPFSVTTGELVFNKRELQTSVLVDNGEIVALGGLLDQNERISKEKIPLLGDLPWVGGLFQSETRETQNTNLMLFIRPVIVSSREAARALSQPELERMILEQRLANQGSPGSLEGALSRLGPVPERSEPGQGTPSGAPGEAP